MPAITISREIGSQGDVVAELTARRLGYHLVDKDIIEKVFRQYGFPKFKEVYNESGLWALFDPQRAGMVKLLNSVTEAMACHGNVVLLGRGGFALLKGYADVLNVRIQAPFSLRVKHMMDRQTFAEWINAENYVRNSDQVRREFVETIYKTPWDSASAFDLVIDTRKIPVEMAVDWLEAAALRLNHLQPGDAPTARAIEIEPALMEIVNLVLSK